jgi:integrase
VSDPPGDALLAPIGAENAHSHNLSVLEPQLGRADRNPAVVYLAGLSEGSRRSTAQAIRVIAEVLQLEVELVPWHRLEYQHTQAVRAALADRYAPATANKILAALRGVLREARRLGLMSAEAEAKATDVKRIRGVRPARGRALGADELTALRAACKVSEALGARDVALLALLYGGGLRRSEAVRLDIDDVAGDELTVHGKGAKTRVAYLSEVHAFDLVTWLGFRGSEGGPLLCPVLRGGRVVLRRLTDQAVLVALRRLAARAGLARFSPHDMRRTFISDLLDKGADIATVAQLAGHSQVTTTARYDRRGERAKRAAAALLTP